MNAFFFILLSFISALPIKLTQPKDANTEQAFKLESHNLPFDVYVSNKRSELNAKKLNHLIKDNKIRVLHFKDTNTLLIPDDEILNNPSWDKFENLGFYEFRLSDLTDARIKQEDFLIPASGCLHFNQQSSSGSLDVAFESKIELHGSGSGGLQFTPEAIGLSYGKTIDASQSQKIAGTHSCSTTIGKSVRIFFQIYTAALASTKKKITYNTKTGEIEEGTWKKSNTIKKYLVNVGTKYFCGTSDKIDLLCSKSYVEFIDDIGNLITSHNY